MAAGRLKWSDYIVDTVHPNDAGHAAAARFLTAMCETAMNAVTTKALNADDPLPPPLHSDAFQRVGWRDAADLVPVANEGSRQTVDDNNKPIWVGTPRAGRFHLTGSAPDLLPCWRGRQTTSTGSGFASTAPHSRRSMPRSSPGAESSSLPRVLPTDVMIELVPLDAAKRIPPAKAFAWSVLVVSVLGGSIREPPIRTSGGNEKCNAGRKRRPGR